MVESRTIRQAEYKGLTSSYQIGGRRYATSKEQRLPKLHRVIIKGRYKARAEICGAIGGLDSSKNSNYQNSDARLKEYSTTVLCWS
jgi:hypothetical protein